MAEISGFPFAPVEVTAQGDLFSANQVEEAARVAERVDDLIVISHGWNNDMAEASRLYERLARHMRDQLPAGPKRPLGVVGILWPSKKFTDDELIPGGGAAGIGDGADETALLEALGRFEAVARPDAPDLDEIRGLAPRLKTDPAARARMLALVNASLDPLHSDDPSEAELVPDDFGTDAETLFNDLGAPDAPTAPPGGGGLGGAAPVGEMTPPPGLGGAAGIGDMLGGPLKAARQLLNLGTYYQMKERAGVVGGKGVAELLQTLRDRNPAVRIHLVGHSFGARVVTAAAAASAASVAPASMTLLQAAFSHNAFSPSFPVRDKHLQGGFRSVIKDGRIAGPILITHTANDKAVGDLYALASRVARQVASGLGDENDVYGGLGRNGALHMPDAELGGSKLRLLGPGEAYALKAGRIHNLRADAFVSGHSDVANAATAHAILSAIG